MTGEELAYAADKLMSAAALDVWITAAVGKKGRPMQLLSVLCTEANKENIVKTMFKHTTTIGVRYSVCKRDVLTRDFFTKDTEYGEIRYKKTGHNRCKPEFEDIKKIAEEKDVSILEIKANI